MSVLIFLVQFPMEMVYVSAFCDLFRCLGLLSFVHFSGKPNPLIMRAALKKLGVDRKEAVIIGRHQTNIRAKFNKTVSLLARQHHNC